MEKLSMSSVRKIDFTIIIIIKLFSLIVHNRDYGWVVDIVEGGTEGGQVLTMRRIA